MSLPKLNTVGNVYVKEWDGISPVLVRRGQVLLFVATGPEHSGYLERLRVVKEAAETSSIKGWYWTSLSSENDSVPGIYIVIPQETQHRHNESPVDFLRKATGLDIKEEDEHPHLHLFHD